MKSEKLKDEEEDMNEDATDENLRLIFGANDTPPWHVSFMFGLQQAIVMAAGIFLGPTIAANLICAPVDARVTMCAASMFTSGLACYLQTTWGLRLPVIQGPSSAFLVPLVALMAGMCQDTIATNVDILNGTVTEIAIDGRNSTPVVREEWREKLLMIQGGQLAAAGVQIILGCTGIMGLLLKYIGPLTVTPTVFLIGIPMFDLINTYAAKQWGVTIMVVVLFLVFAVYLHGYDVPFPSWRGRNNGGCGLSKYPLFKLFPFLFTIVIAWGVCGILTAVRVLSEEKDGPGYYARTDVGTELLSETPWFRVPYPFQFGAPSISIAIFIGMCFSTIASIIQSVGDYYVTANVCGEGIPAKHAINRAIAVEGVGCILAGSLGSGLSVTSYSTEVGTLIITRVACRRATQCAAVIFLVLAVVTKTAAVFATIPDPILGGMMLVAFGMVSAVALSNLQFVNMNNPRNLAILAVSFMFGLCVPRWLAGSPDAIDTGNIELDQAIRVVLGSPMFIGGVIGCVLDNTVPGSAKDRGLFHATVETAGQHANTYNLPYIGTFFERNFPQCSRLPFMPDYRDLRLEKKQSQAIELYSVSQERLDC